MDQSTVESPSRNGVAMAEKRKAYNTATKSSRVVLVDLKNVQRERYVSACTPLLQVTLGNRCGIGSFLIVSAPFKRFAFTCTFVCSDP